MARLDLRSVVKAVVAAALVAALAAAVFHFAVTERVIQQAIDLEEKLQGGSDEEAVVSRGLQRGGLFLGFLMYGVAVGLIFSGVYFLAQAWSQGVGFGRRGLVLAFVGYWAVVLFPFIKYPANPPGVGDPETIYYRQQFYLVLIVLSLAGAALALVLNRALEKIGGGRLDARRRLLLMLAVYSGYMAAIYLVVPSNPDPVPLPMDLVWRFRAYSLVGLTIFWSILGVVSALLLRREAAPTRAGPARGGVAKREGA